MTFDDGCGDAAVFETVLDNRLEEIARVVEEFDHFATENGLENPTRRRVDMALDEVLNNVISYGFDDADQSHTITVRGEVDAGQVTITVTDDGRPFNPFDEDPPGTQLGIEEREVGGLGIHLVRNVMDAVSYRRHENKNEVVLVKQCGETAAT